MTITCAFDQTEHADTESLHAHLKRFKVSRAKYYETYSPRYDRLTGEPIKYRDYEQYHKAEFLTKTNLKKWLSENREAGLEWSNQWLLSRKAEKGLVYAPSQAELRTLMCPSMPYYDSVGSAQGGYYGLTRELGFKDRYTDEALIHRPLPAGATIIQDTREQHPLRLAVPTEVAKVDVGDYRLADPLDLGIRIERKSLTDLCGTLSGRKTRGGVDSSLARFTRELDRAVVANLYVVLMVESDIADAQRIGYLPQTRHIKASPEYLLHNLRDLLVRYPLHLQALFVKGRVEMAAKVVRVLELGDQVRRLDLQSRYERGEL